MHDCPAPRPGEPPCLTPSWRCRRCARHVEGRARDRDDASLCAACGIRIRVYEPQLGRIRRAGLFEDQMDGVDGITLGSVEKGN